MAWCQIGTRPSSTTALNLLRLHTNMINITHIAQLSFRVHYIDVIMTTMASQITSLRVVYSTVNSEADQRKHQSPASLAFHYDDVIMDTIASQITSLTIVYSIVYSDADERKHQSSASLGFVRGIHRGPVNSPHKWPVTRKMFPFDDVIMVWRIHRDRWIPRTKGR